MLMKYLILWNTKDHVPPRGIFPKYHVGQLITVPAHRDCNNQFSEDDGLLRDFVIGASWRTAEGQRAWEEQVVSSWDKNRGAKRELQKRLKQVLVKDSISGGEVLRETILAEVPLFQRQESRFSLGYVSAVSLAGFAVFFRTRRASRAFARL